jgi:hypothetical protein
MIWPVQTDAMTIRTALPMFNLLIILVMLGILVSLGAGLFFLVRDPGKSERIVVSLTIRVALSVLLLALLAWGLASKFVIR